MTTSYFSGSAFVRGAARRDPPGCVETCFAAAWIRSQNDSVSFEPRVPVFGPKSGRLNFGPVGADPHSRRPTEPPPDAPDRFGAGAALVQHRYSTRAVLAQSVLALGSPQGVGSGQSLLEVHRGGRRGGASGICSEIGAEIGTFNLFSSFATHSQHPRTRWKHSRQLLEARRALGELSRHFVSEHLVRNSSPPNIRRLPWGGVSGATLAWLRTPIRGWGAGSPQIGFHKKHASHRLSSNSWPWAPISEQMSERPSLPGEQG